MAEFKKLTFWVMNKFWTSFPMWKYKATICLWSIWVPKKKGLFLYNLRDYIKYAKYLIKTTGCTSPLLLISWVFLIWGLCPTNIHLSTLVLHCIIFQVAKLLAEKLFSLLLWWSLSLWNYKQAGTLWFGETDAKTCHLPSTPELDVYSLPTGV